VSGVFAFTHMLTVIIASSYVTLGIAVPGDARRLAVPYGIVVLVLTVVNLIGYRRARRG
jgi:hypothetical protein